MNVAIGKLKIAYCFSDLDNIEKGDLALLNTDGDLLVWVVKAINKGAVGFLANCGRTNHGMIAAKELSIPFLITNRTDFKEGEIYTMSDSDIAQGRGDNIDSFKAQFNQNYINSDRKVFINLGFPKQCFKKNPALADLVDGVGFARLEFVLLSIIGDIHPVDYLVQKGAVAFENAIYENFKTAISHFSNKLFWIRTDDFSSNQLFVLKNGDKYEKPTTNEIVGFRGIARSIDRKWQDLGSFEPRLAGLSWIGMQFKAINRLKKDFPDAKIGIFAPMVHDVREFKSWLSIAKEYLKEKVDFGVMVETPALARKEGITPFLEQGLIDFMIFGSNDLTALTLGIDRTDYRLAHLFSEENPSVLSSMIETIQLCKKFNVLTAIGGVAASRKSLMEKLYHAGIDIFSVSPQVEIIQQAKTTVVNLEKKYG